MDSEKSMSLCETRQGLCKVNAPVCDPFLGCSHFFIFSSFDEANDKKPYNNHYKHNPE